jgi:hypothetical protein
MGLAFDVSRRCLVLRIQGVEVLIKSLVGRDPRIDCAADLPRTASSVDSDAMQHLDR